MAASHKPKKHLGQNFLHDQRILGKITDACAFTPQDTVVEIGPGKGVLTRLLAPRVKTLYAVEYDKDLVAYLQSMFVVGKGDMFPRQGGGTCPLSNGVHIAHADFLKWDLDNVPQPVKVIGNIPYYISTPIIERLIAQRAGITEAFLTVQLEFGRRLAAKSGGKEYGSLSCFIQYYAEVQVLFKIKNSCFTPVPKVDSCFVRLAFRPQPAYHPKNEAMVFKVIHQAFSQRRKTIVNALSQLADKEKLSGIMTGLKLSPQIRPERLNLQNFVDIADALC